MKHAEFGVLSQKTFISFVVPLPLAESRSAEELHPREWE